jgi:phospholipase C
VNPHKQPGDPIKYVVLLLFENHSFDQMLGRFKRVFNRLAGVDPGNPTVNRNDGKEFRQGETTELQIILHSRHEVNHVAAQMKDHHGRFVKDFIEAMAAA